MLTKAMTSFFRKTFGWLGSSAENSAPAPAHEPEIYKDCTIAATPMREGSQWRLAGSITRVVNGDTVERTFIRADLFSSEDEARSFSIRKAQQIIDQNGAALFAGDTTGSA